ncbi:RidA family protein [Candidatus Binatia bacterium]|jgi:enamine deaminase RidA (YjgF/YER057c/UK114 family)|nr:RidA family protein [Candidatus Binatia bacterium]
METVSDRLLRSGIELPAPLPAAGAYSPVVVDGDLAYTSGLIAVGSGGLEHPGRLGVEVSVEQGQQSARRACLLSLSALDAELGGLDHVVRIVKLVGYVRAAADFENLPAVLDGASHLLLEVFGGAGRAARSTVGVAALPFGASVEIDLVARVKVS